MSRTRVCVVLAALLICARAYKGCSQVYQTPLSYVWTFLEIPTFFVVILNRVHCSLQTRMSRFLIQITIKLKCK